MNYWKAASYLATFTWVFFTQTVDASLDTIGPSGINSSGLGLNGAGIGIGQVEVERPGLPAFDLPGNSDGTITPAGVFLRDGMAVADTHISEHAQYVAGVMISTDAT
jgi:hypothetical protein